MSAPEEIVLPRSGVRLTRMPGTRATYYSALIPDVRLALDTRPAGCCPVAWCRNDAGHNFETSADATAWLDRCILDVRSALLAGTEDIIIAALRERGMAADEADARAVLSALTGGTDE